MKNVIKYTTYSIIGIFVILLLIFFINTRERHSNYKIDLNLQSQNIETQLYVGLGKAIITPKIIDTWTDIDNNAKYEPDKGDTYQDNNNNNKFDAYWIAGFSQKRASNGVNDDIWARTIIIEKGELRIAYVVLDAIGFFYDDVIDIRKEVSTKNWNIDHVIVSSTHCHEVPDLMGLWGSKWYQSGVNKEYMNFVKSQSIKSIENAVNTLRPAIIKVGKLDSTGINMKHDSREPIVIDDAIHILQFIDVETTEPFGILVNWANHPETAGSKNLMITADFPNYLIEGLEIGISYNNEIKEKGLGGIAIYSNGAVGGLMCSLRDHISNQWTGEIIKKDGLKKIEAQGYTLAKLILDYINADKMEILENSSINLLAKTIFFDVDNKTFLMASALKVLNRGYKGISKMRSEIDLLKIGSVSILFIPGEIYPEIVNGGVESPKNGDYFGQPIESPSLFSQMNGKYNFVVGLANDEIGYIIPKTQWDKESPFTYNRNNAPYGEQNSLGPETGPKLYREAVKLINQIK